MKHTKDESEFRDQTLGVLFAGRDTTSSLLLWTLSPPWPAPIYLMEAGYFLVRFLQRCDGFELGPAEGRRIGKTIGATSAPVEVRIRLHEVGE